MEKIIGNSEISAFVAALKEDVEGLAKIFQENKNIKCYDNIMKFNLFHIAAISNNQGIVDMIYANCNKDLALELDKEWGVNAHSYSYMGYKSI
ncbi:MAG: hypothetical protein MRQ09_04005 [Candidatus Midichloria sp.]|nr:hypothetical protein [Candidatus Midichloria sp.]